MTNGSASRRRSSQPGWRVGVGVYALLATGSWVVLLFSGPPSTVAVPSPGDQPSTSVSTPYLDTVAASLETTHAYVDPLVADLAPEGLTSGPLHDALTADQPQAFAAFVVTDHYEDGSNGDPDLIAKRLHHLVGQDGLYLVDYQHGYCRAVSFVDGEPHDAYCGSLTVADLDRMRKRASPSSVDDWFADWGYPVVVGTGACVLVGWALRGIGWLRRRDVAFLQGVR